MSEGTSNWIPWKRIRFVMVLALLFAIAAAVGSVWSLFALVLLVPALGAGWAAFVMLRIRRQLSANGGGWERRIHEAVIARLELAPNARVAVLDIGCGEASLLAALLKRTPQVEATGVDYWGANWDYAQAACEKRLAKLGLRAAFRRMDAAKLDFPDASFDAVVSVMCFHEVKAGGEMRGPVKAVSEALRVLKPGGVFVLADRFADAGDYGAPAELAGVLKPAVGLKREPVVAAMGVPWPLSSKRALGPVEMISGRKSA